LSDATGTAGRREHAGGRSLLVAGVVLTQLVALGLAGLLWYAGTRDAPPLGWEAVAAGVPIVGLWLVNRRWHRQWTAARQDGSPPPPI
jgi:hypothetical protein